MVGTFEFQPPGKIRPRLRVRPGVRFGQPLDFSRYYGMESDRLVLRAVTDEIMYALMNLSGQEYVDVYAASAKGSSHRLRRHRREKAELPASSEKKEPPASGEQAELPETGEQSELPETGEQSELPETGEQAELPANGEKAELPES
jgi:hypothetical protein